MIETIADSGQSGSDIITDIFLRSDVVVIHRLPVLAHQEPMIKIIDDPSYIIYVY